MGYSKSSSSDWDSYTRSAAPRGASASAIYTNRSGMKAEYDPKKISVRESRDSDANPESTPIIVGLDGTGSMDSVLEAGIKNMGSLFTEIYDKKPVTDPHIMAMVFGDVAAGDSVPLQATQFESDIVIIDQLKDLYLERGGGGNRYESYHLPLYFAATRTDCDAFKKGRKGFIFTIGDERAPEPLTRGQIQRVFGSDESAPDTISYEELLTMVSPNYNVYHLKVRQTATGRHDRTEVDRTWLEVLGQNAVSLENVDDIAEVITAILRVNAGETAADVAGSYSGTTAVTVREAITGLTTTGAGSAVARL